MLKSKNISVHAIFNDQSFNDTLPNDIVSFEQLGQDQYATLIHHLLCIYVEGNKLPKYWATKWENRDSNQSAHPCGSLISLCCPHKYLHPWLSKMWLVKLLTRLLECTGWSESSLGAHVCFLTFRIVLFQTTRADLTTRCCTNARCV